MSADRQINEIEERQLTVSESVNRANSALMCLPLEPMSKLHATNIQYRAKEYKVQERSGSEYSRSSRYTIEHVTHVEHQVKVAFHIAEHVAEGTEFVHGLKTVGEINSQTGATGAATKALGNSYLTVAQQKLLIDSSDTLREMGDLE